LLRLHWLNRTIVSVQKNAFTVRLFLQRQSTSILTQPGVFLNELVHAQSFKRCQSRDLALNEADLSRPPATRRASLTFVKDRHSATYPSLATGSNPIQRDAPLTILTLRFTHYVLRIPDGT
jgi:hypothetical protein